MINIGYTKEQSEFVAGIAVLMMFFYHFFAFPSLWPSEDCFYSIWRSSTGIQIERLTLYSGNYVWQYMHSIQDM